MAWTEITRRQYRRDGLRHASGTTEEEWAIVAPLPPEPPSRGRPRKTCLRDVLDAIFYLVRTGCQWWMRPGDFPPFTTVQRYFYKWRDAGIWASVNHALLLDVREAEGRSPSPLAGIIDSQSVKSTEAGGPRGYAAEKKVKGRKRDILTDTGGLLLAGIVHPGDIQDRDGPVSLMSLLHGLNPWLRHLIFDAAYAGDKLKTALSEIGGRTTEVVRRPRDSHDFVLLLKRRVVERTLAWLNRNRRLAKDFEATVESAATWLYIAHVKLLVRRPARREASLATA